MAPNIPPLPDSTTAHVDDKGKPTKDSFNWLKSVSDFVNKNAFPKLLIGSPTGGDKGAGTVNAEAVYDSGNRVLTALTGALLAANNLSDVANAATARSNLSSAAKAQTFAIGGYITSPGTATFDVVGLCPAAFGGTLTKFTGVLLSGSCTMTLNINGTPVTNGVVTATTTRSSVSPTAANVFVANDLVTVTSSLATTPSQFFYTLVYTRTLA